MTEPSGSSSLARLTRIGLTLGLKSHPGSRIFAKDPRKHQQQDDDWYIPYNGPYEPPREPRKEKQRDSWGDPLNGDDEDEEDGSLLQAKELHNRYGGYTDFAQRNDFRHPSNESKGRGRDRSFSALSGRTVSSGAVDPSQMSVATQRRSTISSGNRPPVPSFIHLDTSGGVGEAPMPVSRNHKDSGIPNRLSIGTFFSFSGQKTPTSPVPPLPPDKGSARAVLHKNLRRDTKQQKLTKPTVHSSVVDTQKEKTVLRGRLGRPTHMEVPTSVVTDQEEYYNSYYSTLVQTPKNESPLPNSFDSHQSSHPFHSTLESNSSTYQQHPYAYAFPELEKNQESPIEQSGDNPFNTYQDYGAFEKRGEPSRLTFSQPVPQKHAPHFSLPRRMQQLKGSISTPDLRVAKSTPSFSNSRVVAAQRTKLPFLPKGRERWLSAETWCDALLFPRPRLKLKQDSDEVAYTASGRIVSPPGSPLFGYAPDDQGVASRVLAHSRSLLDFENAIRTSSENIQPIKAMTSKFRVDPGPSEPPNPIPQPTRKEAKPRRPRSFAQDDLALLSPVPSLARVIEEGENLETQREKWKIKAKESFGNKRSRSLSRSRSKSLTQKGRRRVLSGNGNIDFLAARACVGNQDVVPVSQSASSRRQAKSSTSDASYLARGESHSHTTSISKTLSKSSKSHSRGHSRTDSWSKSALKMAKSTVNICGFSADGSPSMENLGDEVLGLESALRRNDTRVIRLADPAQLPVDHSYGSELHGETRNGISPVPSALSESKVGLAVSTSPLHSEESYDRESIRLPSHPYAQGGYSLMPPTATSHQHKQEQGDDYAGPHRSTPINANLSDVPEVLARHRYPPHVVLHPYAQASSTTSMYSNYSPEEKLVPQPRQDSTVPPSDKMWAQLSPGVVREILPGDIQYSPFASDRGDDSPAGPSPRFSTPIFDMIGVGNALVNATRNDKGNVVHGREKGVLVSSDEMLNSQPEDSPELISRIHRRPVQYGPTYSGVSLKPSNTSTNHTLASSPLVTAPDPKPDGGRDMLAVSGMHASEMSSLSPAVTSESSSPAQSPRPLGSPNDLENFRDLFYRPSPRKKASADRITHESPTQLSHVPWDISGSRSNHQTGSGLTTLARQLSKEFENMAVAAAVAAERERSPSSGTSSPRRLNHSTSVDESMVGSPTGSSSSVLRRRIDGGSLKFVFEEPRPESSTVSVRELLSPGSLGNEHESIMAFRPSSDKLPEDVDDESLRASSLMEKPENELEDDDDDDDTAMFRVGMVESVSTPPIVHPDHHHRISFAGKLSFDINDDKLGASSKDGSISHNKDSKGNDEPSSPNSRTRAFSGLHPPTEATRSSYITTTSDASRMSGLSDFPSPPKDMLSPGRMSLLSSYFDEAMSQSEARSSETRTPTPPQHEFIEDNRRFTFGGDGSDHLEDFADALAASVSRHQ